MKRLALLTVLALVPASMALAQNSLDEEINAELDRMYQQKSSRSAPPSVQVNVQTNPTATATPYNNQVSGQTTKLAQEQATTTVQRAPITVIESSPLDDSRAEKLRKARQEAEMKTEESMVERLEKSRLDDERRRAEALFGDRYRQIMDQKSEQTTQQVIVNQNNGKQGDVIQPSAAVQAPVQAPVQVQAPPVYSEQPVIIPTRPDDKDRDERRRNHEREEEEAAYDREKMRNDKRGQKHDDDKHDEKHDDKDHFERRNYISGLLGMSEYSDAINVRGNFSVGVALGTNLSENLLVEGNFLYSSFDIQQADSGPYPLDPVFGRITKMNQYGFVSVLKYQLLHGMIRPVVGGVAGYTYRTFEDKQLAFPNNNASSHAIDLGVMAGVDVEVTKSFSIGADFRYMWNLYNRTNNSGFQQRFSQTVLQCGTPIEEISYMSFFLVGRATF